MALRRVGIRSHYRAVFDESQDAIVVLSPHGRLRDLNTAAARLFGGLSGQLFLQTIEALVSALPDASERELSLPRGDGSQATCLVRQSTTVDRHGRVLERRLTIRDVSPVKALEAQLHQSAKMETVGRFACAIAHDFNNLLTAIIGYAEFLQVGAADTVAARRDAAQIFQAGQTAAALTKQLLAFSRTSPICRKNLDLNAEVSSIEPLLKRLMGAAIAVEVLLAPLPALIRADKAQINQVLLNLAVNARDAMPGGGRLRIEIANVSGCIIDPKRGARQYIKLTVADSGCGMDDNTRRQLFNAFFTTKQESGHGIGLVTVHNIIEQSNGFVHVSSEPGYGTSFELYFPAVRNAESTDTAPNTSEVASRRGSETILVADDEDGVRALIAATLRRHGYSVLTAPTGEAALQLAETAGRPIDLVVADLVMPSMSGRELAERLLTMRPELKVIFVSGYSTPYVLTHGLIPDGAPFVPKPFHPATFLAAVRRVLDAAPPTETSAGLDRAEVRS